MANVDVYGFDLPNDQNAYYFRDNRLDPNSLTTPDLVPDTSAEGKITFEAGGYTTCGKLAVVNIRFRIGIDQLIGGSVGLYACPKPFSTYGTEVGNSIGTTCNNLHQAINITDRGYLVTGSDFLCVGGYTASKYPPANWSTTYNNYYHLEGTSMVKNNYSQAPTWYPNLYYSKGSTGTMVVVSITYICK